MKKLRIKSSILIFLLCFVSHFLYEWMPSVVISIFFPVNESIWEHMKLLFTTILLYHLFEYIYLYYKKINFNNYCIASFVSSLLSIPIYLVMFLPIYYAIGENMVVTFIILFITICLAEIIHYSITIQKSIKYQCIISIVLIIISYIVFGYLTYDHPKTDFFYDTVEEKYGINQYIIK